MPKSYIPMLFFASSLIQTIATAPLAKLSGTGVATRNRLLGAGFLVMVAANGVFASAASASLPGGWVCRCVLLHVHQYIPWW